MWRTCHFFMRPEGPRVRSAAFDSIGTLRGKPHPIGLSIINNEILIVHRFLQVISFCKQGQQIIFGSFFVDFAHSIGGQRQRQEVQFFDLGSDEGQRLLRTDVTQGTKDIFSPVLRHLSVSGHELGDGRFAEDDQVVFHWRVLPPGRSSGLSLLDFSTFNLVVFTE